MPIGVAASVRAQKWCKPVLPGPEKAGRLLKPYANFAMRRSVGPCGTPPGGRRGGDLGDYLLDDGFAERDVTEIAR
jgi:hypothetical protein